jgi:hypothetical protein
MLYVLEAPSERCNPLSGIVGMMAPDNSYTTAAIGQVVAEHLAALSAAPHRNRLWTAAPDGALWYLARRYPEGIKELNRQDSAGKTQYPLPAAVAETVAAGAQRLEVDAHNHAWLVAANQLWRLSSTPDFALEVQPSNWLLAPTLVRTGEIAIRSRAGYSSTVTLAVINSPSAMNVNIEPNPVAVGQSARLTLTATADSLPATYPLLLQASDGTLTHTVTLTVTVAAQVSDLYLPVIAR